MSKRSFAVAAFLALSASACGGLNLPTSPASTPEEEMLLSETTRLAGMLFVKVRGEITDACYETPGGQALGWLSNGVAYYNRALVAQYVSISPEAGKETATNIAAHEVCHTQTPGHNLLHWNCSLSLGATPTYPRP